MTLALAAAFVFAALIPLPAVRVGDGSEYYGMFLAWKGTLRPFMTEHSWDAYSQLFATGRIRDLVAVTALRQAFPALHLGATSDFNHFWFYSAFAALISSMLGMLGRHVPPHGAFILAHAVVFAIPLVLARRSYGWTGPAALVALTVLSPMVWYVNKVHTEFFTYCLALSAVILVSHGRYIAAAFFLGAASTQNPSFAVVAAFLLCFGVLSRERAANTLLGTVLIVLTVLLALLHPAYYFFRYGVLTPQLLAGGARLGAVGSIWYVWLVDPDVGLLPNWPLGLVLALIALVTALRGRAWVGRGAWLAFVSIYVLISLLAQSSTQNVNSGATPGVARYALWYIPLFFPIALHAIDWSTRRKSALVFSATLIVGLGTYNFSLNRPGLAENDINPSPPSYFLQKYLPAVYDPYAEIFAERYGGLGEEIWQRNVLGVVGPDCRKLLVFGNPSANEVVGGSGCLLDPSMIASILRGRVEKMAASGEDHSYVRISDEEAWRAAFHCPRRMEFNKSASLPQNALLGFSSVEHHGRWSDGDRASFTCLVDQEAPTPKRVRIIAHAFVPNDHLQRMRISINGSLFQEVSFINADERVIELHVPQGKEERIELRFEFPDAVSPRELGLSADPRKIGVGFRAIEFE